MNNKKAERIFRELTRFTMTILTAVSFYILYSVTEIVNSPEYAMHYYHSYPRMVESVLASIVIYLAFSIVFMKIYRD